MMQWKVVQVEKMVRRKRLWYEFHWSTLTNPNYFNTVEAEQKQQHRQQKQQKLNVSLFDAIYLHHGFGAMLG